MTTPTPANLLAAVADEALFARWFRDRVTWAAWFTFIAVQFGLPLDAAQVAIYQQCTGRKLWTLGQVHTEAWLICGRRAGKSLILALVAVFLAAFRDYAAHLVPGERATILIIATDRKQARVIFRYCRAFLTLVPMLKAMVERETADAFDLVGNVTIEIATASYRSTRGYTIAAALCDELAFWPSDDAAEPDYAVLDALRPGMATIPGAMLLCASSPYARRGALWDAWRQHFGQEGDPVLVWKAATRTMNPTVPQSVIDRAAARDPAVAAAEYGAEFRSDLEAFVTREAIEGCVSTGVRERPPESRFTYVGFVDPSGGVADAMTLAIAHLEGNVVVLDATRERLPPFSPQGVVEDYATFLKSYRINAVSGDRYAGEWPREAFGRHGIAYTVAGAVRSDLYLAVLPTINSKRIDLLDDPKIVAQFTALERRVGRGGKDAIDHRPGAHDDLVNSIAGVSFQLLQRTQAVTMAMPILVTLASNQSFDNPDIAGSMTNPALGRGTGASFDGVMRGMTAFLRH